MDNGTALVYVGGFSYAPPYSYPDVVKLSFGPEGAAPPVWSRLPPLPYAISSMGVAAVGQTL